VDRPGIVVRPSRWDAVRLLRLEVLLLFVLPAGLVVGPLGGVGSPARVLGLALFMCWACFLLTPGLGVRPCVPLRLALASMWAATLGSYTLLHRNPVVAIEATSSDSFIILLLAFSGVALTAAECLRTREEILAVIRVAVAGAAFSAAVALLQFLGFDLTVYLAKIPLLTIHSRISGLSSRGGFNRPAGTAIHPIEFGVVTAVALAFAVHLLLYDSEVRPWRRWLCFGVIAIAVPISLSRSALVVAAIVVGYFFAGVPAAVRARCGVFLAGFGAFIFMAVPGLLGTLRGLVLAGQSDDSISTRTSDYAVVARYVRPNPWFGRGPGTFLPSYRILDNQYLLTLIETGTVGLIALIILFSATGSLGRAARRHSVNTADQNLSQMFRAAGAGVLVSLATFDALSFPTLTTFSALWLGLAGAWWTTVRSAGAPRDRY